MSDILIKGMELPKKGNIGLLLYSDGSVEICGTGSLSKPLYGVPIEKAIEIPPHGRCIDADSFKSKLIRARYADKSSKEKTYNKALDILFDAPTVLEVTE